VRYGFDDEIEDSDEDETSNGSKFLNEDELE